MPGQDKGQVKATITSSTTTVLISETRHVSQIVVVVASPGTAWHLSILDNGSPALAILGDFVIAAQNGQPLILKFDKPLRMENQIKVVTTGATPGIACVWVDFGVSE